ncbi:MAG TPA: hypothetical protein PKA63_08335 [Oligoflexia bacterium]|nr:hypothetical protein [Oligoflexia bacterium]HMP48658.1 hypothetical protein [Oligoflexia bacterium]
MGNIKKKCSIILVITHILIYIFFFSLLLFNSISRFKFVLAEDSKTDKTGEKDTFENLPPESPIILVPSESISAPIESSAELNPYDYNSKGINETITRNMGSHGAYLTNVAACGFCHGHDPEKPNTPLSGGLVISDSYGEVVVPNITSDTETGIGKWTELELMHAIRSSIGRNGEKLSIDAHRSYRWLSDSDVREIVTYLKNSAPVVKKHPRRSVSGLTARKWGIISQHETVKGFVPVLPKKSAGYYGLYLVHIVGACARCHSPNELSFEKEKYLAGSKSSKFLAVTESLRSKDVEAPSLRNNEVGILNWRDDDMIQFFREGRSKSSEIKSVYCPQLFWRGFDDQDIKSIITYLRSLN